MRHTLSFAAILLALSACGSLLQTDFDTFPTGSFSDQTFDLAGAPSGDRLIYFNSGFVVQDSPGDRSLAIFRDVLNDDVIQHGEAYFDPIDASADRPIFFTWSGILNPNQAITSDPAIVAIKLKDLIADDQPNLFSKLIIRFGEEEITAQVAGGNQVSIGNSVTGLHGIILRIDPVSNEYRFAISGPGVSPGGGFTHIGNLGQGANIDPTNIGVSITFSDELDAAGSLYTIDDMKISQSES